MKTIIKFCCCLLLVGLLAGMNSCQKENLVNPSETGLNEDLQTTPTNAKIRVVDGRLAFDSMEDFQRTKETLNQSQDELESWEGQFAGFTSMRNAFDRLTVAESESIAERIEDYPFATIIERDGEKYFESPIQNPIIKSMVNKESMIQIGGEVYKFTYNNQFKASVGNLADLKQATDTRVPTSVTKQEIKRTIQDLADSRGRQTIGRCEIKYRAGRQFKLKGQIQREDLALNNGDCIMSTKHYRRGGFGIYYLNRLPYMYLHVKGHFVLIWNNCNGNPFKWFSRYESGGNVHTISEVISRNPNDFGGCNSGAVTPLHDGAFWSEYHGSTLDGKYRICTIECPPLQGCDY